MIIIEFFRDTLSGPIYFLYLIVCIVLFFALLGIVGDRKRAAIEEKLKEKKKYDIESGREAEIAALESKQNLDVMTEEEPKKEEVPSVIVLDSEPTPVVEQSESSTNSQEVTNISNSSN